jgi:hypothetical protein
MSWRSAKPAIIRLTRKHEIYCFFSRKGIGTVEEMEGVETPVEAIETKMFGEPVFKLVFALGDVSGEGEQRGRQTVSKL